MPARVLARADAAIQARPWPEFGPSPCRAWWNPSLCSRPSKARSQDRRPTTSAGVQGIRRSETRVQALSWLQDSACTRRAFPSRLPTSPRGRGMGVMPRVVASDAMSLDGLFTADAGATSSYSTPASRSNCRRQPGSVGTAPIHMSRRRNSHPPSVAGACGTRRIRGKTRTHRSAWRAPPPRRTRGMSASNTLSRTVCSWDASGAVGCQAQVH